MTQFARKVVDHGYRTVRPATMVANLFVMCLCVFAGSAIGQDEQSVFSDLPDLLGEESTDLLPPPGGGPQIDPGLGDESSSAVDRELPGLDNADSGFSEGGRAVDFDSAAPRGPAGGGTGPGLQAPAQGAGTVPPNRNDGLMDSEAAMADDDAEIIASEVVKERYTDGTVKIERGVTQDENQNYINHGPWTMYDTQGRVVAEGNYRFGQRHGKWVRVYGQDESPLFSLPPFNLFGGPFISRAEFRDGVLNGHWIITDPDDHKVVDWIFVDGRRHGDSAWFYHTGRPMRVIQYEAGALHGEFVEWDINGTPVTEVEYQQGRRLEKTAEQYDDGQTKLEGMVLHAQLLLEKPDDWWEARLATYKTKGKDQKHGDWQAWYSSGQKKFAGQYQLDRPSGEFAWWHANGQKSLQGVYEAGQKQGEWTWWHENGIKSIQGYYSAGSPVGQWIWWHETGKVAQRIDFSSGTPAAPTSTQSNAGR